MVQSDGIACDVLHLLSVVLSKHVQLCPDWGRKVSRSDESVAVGLILSLS